MSTDNDSGLLDDLRQARDDMEIAFAAQQELLGEVRRDRDHWQDVATRERLQRERLGRQVDRLCDQLYELRHAEPFAGVRPT